MQEPTQAVKASRAPASIGGLLLAAALLLTVTAGGLAQPPAPDANGAGTPAITSPSPLGTISYTPGRGARLGETGFALGGYSSLDLVRDEGSPARLSLDDLSFFLIADPTPRVHLFSELEIEDLVEIDDHGRGGATDANFVLERLYGDLAFSDHLALRAGKFLTPVGRWNVIHAQPLVWTTSRPLATLLPFDVHTTGAMLFGSFFQEKRTLSYELFGQFTDQLYDTEPHRPTWPRTDRSGGARLEYGTSGGWSIGTTYLAFTDAGRWRHVTGLDGLWRSDSVELMSEFVHSAASDGAGTEWGLYLQAVGEVLPRIYLVGRYEHYEQRAPGPTVNIGVAGLAFKPLPYLLLKVEYLFADERCEESPPGFKSSVAILF